MGRQGGEGKEGERGKERGGRRKGIGEGKWEKEERDGGRKVGKGGKG